MNAVNDFIDDASESLNRTGVSNDDNIDLTVNSNTLDSPKYTRRPHNNNSNNDNNNDNGQPFLNDPRMHRIAMAEAALREDMFRECTFRPKIKPLPESYGAMKDPGISFIARATKWQKEKDMALANKEKMLRMDKESECTFNPKINRNSDKAVKEIRGNEYSESANDRLYRNSDLYLQQRSQLINEVKEKEEQLMQAQCPFKPNLVTKNTPIHNQVSSRFLYDIERKKDPDSAAAAKAAKDCTFTPTINKVAPSMSSAKLYLSTNVVDRLTRPIAVDEGDNDISGPVSRSNSNADGMDQMFDESFDKNRPVLDMASFMASLDKKGSFSTPNNAQRPRPASTGKSRPMTEQEKEQRKQQFAAFLARQNHVLKRKEDQVKMIEKSQTPKFQPQISKKAQTVSRPKFIDRIDGEIKRRQANEQSNETKVNDPNCTFKPQINRRSSEKLRPRSSYEMSRGDLQRAETNRRKLKLEADQQALAGATFQPELSKRAQKAKSVLRLSQDPSQFLEWHRNSTLKKEQKRLEILRQKEEEETKECSFSPKTTECPAYVKRIAKSMSIVKAARNSTGSFLDPEANKPQWR